MEKEKNLFENHFSFNKDTIGNLSDDDLNAVAGGLHAGSCPDPRCVYRNNRCECPDIDEDDIGD